MPVVLLAVSALLGCGKSSHSPAPSSKSDSSAASHVGQQTAMVWWSSQAGLTSAWLDGARERARRPYAVFAIGSGLWRWRTDEVSVEVGKECGNRRSETVDKGMLQRVDREETQEVSAPRTDEAKSFDFYSDGVSITATVGPYVFFTRSSSLAACQSPGIPTVSFLTWDGDRRRLVTLLDDKQVPAEVKSQAALRLGNESGGRPEATGMFLDGIVPRFSQSARLEIGMLLSTGGGYYSSRTWIAMPQPPSELAAYLTIPASVVQWAMENPSLRIGGVSVLRVVPAHLDALRSAFDSLPQKRPDRVAERATDPL